MGQGSPLLLTLTAVASFALAYVGASVGLVLGHVRLPMLQRYLGSAPIAAAANGLISAAGALAGAVRQVREGHVSWPSLLLMGVPSVVGAAAAAFLITRQLSSLWAEGLVGLLLAVVGAAMLGAGPVPDGAGPGRPNVALEILIGLVLGAVSAVTGLMLGSLRLPMMIRVLKLDPKRAVGTNMVIGCLTGLAGSVTVLRNAAVPWADVGLTLLAVVPPTALGMWLGGRLTGVFSKAALQRLAGWVLGLTGVEMLARCLYTAATIVGWPGLTEEDPTGEWDRFTDD